jgi:glyceraldehyde 3-phosphate dehydrogenase
MTKVAINGLGRIGRAALKIILKTPELDLVAANDLVDAEDLAYLITHDTVYGRYRRSVEAVEGALMIKAVDPSEAGEGSADVLKEKKIQLSHEKDPARLPWRDLDIDIVLECTGVFTKKEDLEKHLQAGAGTVILSAPSKSEEIVTVVHGTNQPEEDARIISCASCTTNCITPVVEVMERRIGINKAIMTTIHAYTASQAIVDGPHKKRRRGRAGAANFVPTTTGAAVATTKVMPKMKGKFDGVAVRAPIPSGSISDIIFVTERKTSVEEVNGIFQEESRSDRYRDVLGAADDDLVSSDIVGDPRASIVDLGMTQVVDGDLVKVMAWYDNEWGYACQMIRETVRLAQASSGASE